MVSIGWWVHRDVCRESTQIAEEQAQEQLWALVDQLNEGVVPVRRSAVPYEVVASGRRSAVAYGGGMDAFDVIAAVAYFAVRIALRPVEAIRVLTASVTGSDPRERVTVPATGHEITALATTINTTLQRLDNAAAQQRRFVADAAHELRSPLTTLLAGLEVALAYPERTDWPAAATTAARQTRRLHALAEDLRVRTSMMNSV